MRNFFLLLLTLNLSGESRFTAEKSKDHGVDIVRLTDSTRQVQLSLAPSIGNRAYELKVHGKNLLYFPTDIAAFKESGGSAFNGIPFLAPWGNRIPGGGFWANGKRYNFNLGLHNLSVNSGIAIHGMLAASPHWEVTDLGADNVSAHVTSRFRFWQYPDLMANWPFAQDYEITYALTERGVEIATLIKNIGAEPMPVAIGFHPYFNIPNVPRSELSIHVPANKHVEMDRDLVATGQLTASELADQVSLKDRTFDDGYTDLVPDSAGLAAFSVQSGDKKIEVDFGPKYKVALVFAPPHQNYVCFEPMAGITNAVNLAHDGKYDQLQTVAAGGNWRESFWIRFSGL